MTTKTTEHFRLEQDPRRYMLGNRELAGVTTVLQEKGFIDLEWFTEASRVRGSYVHAACHYLDEGKLDWKTVDPKLEGYVRAWERCKIELGIETFIDIETPIYHETLLFAGTPDRRAVINRDTIVLDIKTSKPQDWHGLQTAAYDILYGGYGLGRLGVYLAADGTYRVHWYRDRQDKNIFLAALACYQWQKNRNKGGKPS